MLEYMNTEYRPQFWFLNIECRTQTLGGSKFWNFDHPWGVVVPPLPSKFLWRCVLWSPVTDTYLTLIILAFTAEIFHLEAKKAEFW